MGTEERKIIKCSVCGRYFDRDTDAYVSPTRDLWARGICRKCFQGVLDHGNDNSGIWLSGWSISGLLGN